MTIMNQKGFVGCLIPLSWGILFLAIGWPYYLSEKLLPNEIINATPIILVSAAVMAAVTGLSIGRRLRWRAWHRYIIPVVLAVSVWPTYQLLASDPSALYNIRFYTWLVLGLWLNIGILHYVGFVIDERRGITSHRRFWKHYSILLPCAFGLIVSLLFTLGFLGC